MPGNGFNVVGAHTDSPNLRLKPNPEATREGFVQFEIEPYGGGLWTTWFDRYRFFFFVDLFCRSEVCFKKGFDVGWSCCARKRKGQI